MLSMTQNSDICLTKPGGSVQPPAVAGLFYPRDRAELGGMVAEMLEEAAGRLSPPKALIAPHAGYIYSGPVAAKAYASLRPSRETLRRVVLLGPAHRVYLRGMALPSADRFATPLGEIPVDQELRAHASDMPGVRYLDEAFAAEHSLEVHLPFLQSVLKEFTLLPVVVGDAPAAQVAGLLDAVWGGAETLIVISSDLSHFHDYQTACKLDAQTAASIEALDNDRLGPEQACGCMPMHGLLELARARNMGVTRLELRNSGDTAGDRQRVVGYGAFAFHETASLDQDARNRLLDIAFDSIEHGFSARAPRLPDPEGFTLPLTDHRGLFVTLNIGGRLRGCVGNTEPLYPLYTGVARSAYDAAFNDPRFRNLQREEFASIDLGISILTPGVALRFDGEADLLAQLRPVKHGLIIRNGSQSATFLPAVWDKLPAPIEFLAELKQKAGIRPEAAIEAAWTYESISFGRNRTHG